MWNRSSVLLLSLVMTQSALAGSARDALDYFFNETEVFAARFEQSVYGERSQAVQQSAGTMVLQRPGQFRWDYVKPYNQIIVGDGGKVWIYDEDLAQVTVRSQEQTLGATPAQLLSTGTGLTENFSIDEMEPQAGLDWVALTPNSDEGMFEQIRLGFRSKTLVTMELRDSLGHRTVLTFSDVKVNSKVDTAMFKLDIPEGVDVVGE